MFLLCFARDFTEIENISPNERSLRREKKKLCLADPIIFCSEAGNPGSEHPLSLSLLTNRHCYNVSTSDYKNNAAFNRLIKVM